MSDLEIEVTGATPIINRAFESCGPYQWARELLKNALEAEATKVLFGVEWQAVENKGVYRRIVVDNGHGMTRKELKAYFKTIGIGSKTIAGVHQNFGLGARISLLARNKRGLIIISYKDGEASMVWMAYDEASETYVLLDLEDADTGKHDVVVPPQDFSGDPDIACDFSKIREYAKFPKDDDPIIDDDHGTIFVLLGNDYDEDTVINAPYETDVKGPIKYLNTRFWDVSDVEVRIPEFRGQNKKTQWPRDREDKDEKRRFNWRRIRGVRHYMFAEPKDGTGKIPDKNKGVVHLDGGRVHAHWFLYEGERADNHALVENDGFIAYSYQDELYQVTKERSAFRQFGISEDLVQKRLWIVLEVQHLSNKTAWGVYPNDARTLLLFSGDGSKGETPPRQEWGHEFQDDDKFPEAIREAIVKARGDTVFEVDLEYMKKLATRYGQRWIETILVAATAGKKKLRGKKTGDTVTVGVPGGEERVRTFPIGPRRPKKANAARPGSREARSGGKLVEVEVLEPTESGGVSAIKVRKPLDLPIFMPDPNADNFDKAWHLARFEEKDPTTKRSVVHINTSADSYILNDLIKNFQNQYAAIWADEVRKKVVEGVGTIAVCKVAHALQLAKHEMTPTELEEQYLNEQALTVALMGFIAEEAFISPKLGAFGGKKKTA